MKMGVNRVCFVAGLSRGMFSQMVLSLSGERHGVKEKRYLVKDVVWMKMDVSVVCSVAGLSHGMFSQLVRPCLVKGMVRWKCGTYERYGLKETDYKGVA